MIMAFLAVCFCKSMYAQLPLKSEGFTKTEHGYLLLQEGHSELSRFVPVRSERISNELSNFTTKKLGSGYPLHEPINTDSLVKYGKTYKLENVGNGNTSIIVVPFTLTYKIPAYARTKEQMEMNTSLQQYKISNKLIEFSVVGGTGLQIISSTPKLYFYEVKIVRDVDEE